MPEGEEPRGRDEETEAEAAAGERAEQAWFDSLWNPAEGQEPPGLGQVMPARAFHVAAEARARHVDLGPGGSLQQRADAARVPWGHRHTAAAAALPTGAAALASMVGAAAAGLVSLAVGLAILAVALLAAGTALAYTVANPAGWLARQARRERAVARALRPLEAGGWVVLYDRELTDSRHRVAALAIGPSGVTVVTPLPHAGLVRTYPGPAPEEPDRLVIGGVNESAWDETRRWESVELDELIPAALGDTVWEGTTMRCYVALGVLRAHRLALTPKRFLHYPRPVNTMPCVPPWALRRRIAEEQPATLGPEQVQILASVLHRAFRPAGRETLPDIQPTEPEAGTPSSSSAGTD